MLARAYNYPKTLFGIFTWTPYAGRPRSARWRMTLIIERYK